MVPIEICSIFMSISGIAGEGVDGADLIVDGLGVAAREENFAALARCGHWISLGQASGPLAPLDPDWLLAKSITFSRPVVFDYVAAPAQLLVGDGIEPGQGASLHVAGGGGSKDGGGACSDFAGNSR